MSVQEQYMQLQLLAQQIQAGQKQVQAIEENLQELRKTKHTIEHLKQGQEVLFPIAGGVFARGKLEDADHLIVNVGAGVAVKKSFADSKKVVEDQIQELKKFQQQLIAKVQEQAEQAQKLEKDIEKEMQKNV